MMNRQRNHSPAASDPTASAPVARCDDDGIRKAAVFVANLDTASADAVLDALEPEQATRIRDVLIDLDDIDPRESRRVADEFRRVGPIPSKQSPAGCLTTPSSITPSPATQTPRAAPFHFLHDAEAEKLARVLLDERPQTIALVLSHMQADQAGGVLMRLPGSVQADVIRRLVALEEADPETLREVERALETQLMHQVPMRRRRVAGMQAITGILDACDERIGTQILDNLAHYDGALAQRLVAMPQIAQSSPMAASQAAAVIAAVRDGDKRNSGGGGSDVVDSEIGRGGPIEETVAHQADALGTRLSEAAYGTPPEIAFDDLEQLNETAIATLFQAVGPALATTALFGASTALIDRIVARLEPSEADQMRRDLDNPGPILLRDVETARRQIGALAGRMASEGQIETPDLHARFIA